MNNQFITLPSMGEGVTEATVVKWLKDPGQAVEKGEPVLEVATDKVDTEIIAEQSGFLIQRLVEEGAVVQVDQPLAQISETADAKKLEPPVVQKHAPKAGGSGGPATVGFTGQQPVAAGPRPVAGYQPQKATAGWVRSSPLVRKLAREQGVDLTQVPGSGLHGRITAEDLAAYTQGGATRVPQSFLGGGEVPGLATVAKDGKEFLEGVEVRREPMSKIRRLTAEHMLRSVRTSPHVTTTFEVDLTNVMAGKEKLAGHFQSNHNQKLTLTPFFLNAACQALKKHPDVNASIDGTDILYKDRINLGCAVATDRGLLVPVIRDCQDRDFDQLVLGLNDLVHRARSSALKPEDIVGGTFSVTNPGLYGSVHSQPIINQPQVAIMSVGAIVTRPVFRGDQVVPAPLVQIGLTFDHRLVDGEGGALFLRTVKETLEAEV